MHSSEARRKRQTDIIFIAGAIVIAFLLRIYFASLRTTHESWDSTSYLWLARSIHEGHGLRLWPGAPAHTWFQPLYSWLISLVYPLFGNFETAGYFISALFGSLLIIPVFLLTRFLFSRDAAFLAAAMVVFNYRMLEASTLVLTEMTYAFFWFSGIYFGFIILAGGQRKAYHFLLCGALLGIASLLRTESNFDFLIVLAFLLAIYARQFFVKVPVESRIKLPDIAFFVTPFIVILAPYCYYLFQEMGTFTITGRTVRSVFVVMESENEQYEFYNESPFSIALHRPVETLGRIVRNDDYILRKLSIWAFHPVITVLMGFGFWGNKWSRVHAWRMLLVAVFLFFPWFTYYGITGILNRYYTNSIVWSLILAANGIIFLYEWFAGSDAFQGLRNRFPRLSAKRSVYAICLAIIFLLYIRPFTYPVKLGHFPEHGDQVKDYEIGKWIRTNLKLDDAGVLCASPRIAYYAGARFFGDNDPLLDTTKLKAMMLKNRIDVIVADDLFTTQWFPGLKQLGDSTGSYSFLKYVGCLPYRYDNGVENTALIYKTIR